MELKATHANIICQHQINSLIADPQSNQPENLYVHVATPWFDSLYQLEEKLTTIYYLYFTLLSLYRGWGGWGS